MTHKKEFINKTLKMYPFSLNVDRNVKPSRKSETRTHCYSPAIQIALHYDYQWFVVDDKEMDEAIETIAEIVKADDWNTRFRISSWTKY